LVISVNLKLNFYLKDLKYIFLNNIKTFDYLN